MSRLTPPSPRGVRSWAWTLAALSLATSGTPGCKHGAPPPPPTSTAGAGGESSPPPVAKVPPFSNTAASAEIPKPPGPLGSSAHRPAPGPSSEAILDEARAHVAEAIKHAAEKEPCPTVLPLLDVSYSLVRASTPIEERDLAVFAACAVAQRRWRLLRDLADAIAAGERKLETTYFLPRALVGEGSYDAANTLAKATLRAWPTEGEAYDTAALAALRVKDWDGAAKAADQALLLQRKRGVNNEVTALAHALRGAALLRMGKTDEGVREIDAAKAHEEVLGVTDVTLDAAHALKQAGLLVTVDLPGEAYPGLWPLYAQKVAPLAGFATVVLQSTTDRPLPVLVEVAVDGAETSAESETVQKGKPVTLAMTPEVKPGSPLGELKSAEARDVTVTVSGGVNHATLYKETRKVTFEPRTAMPKVLRSHGEDLRSAFPLEALWVTPKAPAIGALIEAAKGRLRGADKQFSGAAGLSLPQAQAVWDELRSRGVSFHRDPRIDTETEESVPCRLPADTLAAGSGSALESSVLMASLLEAIGLDVVLVATPGHRMVGWMGTPADLAATESGPSTVKSPRGAAFFLETTTVGEGPFDAAVLRGDAAWVAATNDGSVTSGRAQIEGLADLRKRGLAPLSPPP